MKKKQKNEIKGIPEWDVFSYEKKLILEISFPARRKKLMQIVEII